MGTCASRERTHDLESLFLPKPVKGLSVGIQGMLARPGREQQMCLRDRTLSDRSICASRDRAFGYILTQLSSGLGVACVQREPLRKSYTWLSSVLLSLLPGVGWGRVLSLLLACSLPPRRVRHLERAQ